MSGLPYLAWLGMVFLGNIARLETKYIQGLVANELQRGSVYTNLHLDQIKIWFTLMQESIIVSLHIWPLKASKIGFDSKQKAFGLFCSVYSKQWDKC